MEGAHEDGYDRHAEYPHAGAGNHHRIAHIARRAHSVHGNKGKHPQDGFYDAYDVHQLAAQLRRLRLHARNAGNLPHGNRHDRAGNQHRNFRPAAHSDDVFARFILQTRAEALPHDGHQTERHALGSAAQQRFHHRGHPLRRDRQRAHHGNGGLNRQLAELKHALFHAVRNAHLQYAANARRIRTNPRVMIDHDPAPRMAKADHQHHGRNDSGKQRGDRRARNAHSEAENQYRVSNDVHHVADRGYDQRKARIALHAKQRRASVVQRDEGIGSRCDQEIGNRRIHYIPFNRAENQPQQRPVQRDTHDGNQHGYRQHRKEHLARVFGGFIIIAAPQILRADDRAAGRQRGKHIDHQHVDRIHQRYRRYRRRARVADHQRIRRAHQRCKHLFDHQRNDQFSNLLFCKHRTPHGISITKVMKASYRHP